MFTFFLQSYRKGILEFTGSIVEVDVEPDGDEGRRSWQSLSFVVMEVSVLVGWLEWRSEDLNGDGGSVSFIEEFVWLLWLGLETLSFGGLPPCG